MKISVLSDSHLGYGYNSQTENDSFDNLEEALDLSMDSDLIIVTGDIFDSRSPRTAVWARAMSILTKPLLHKSNAKFVSTTKNLREISKRTLESLPMISIFGNHDRRMKGEVNAVEALDHAGILINLNKENIVFEKDGVKVAIHGMSSIPERLAKQTLDEWNPQPIPDCYNILIMHQSIDPYVYSPLEPPTLTKQNLPRGFDLIIDGHMHGHVFDKIGDIPFIIPGSTVITQLEKKEANLEKGFYQLHIGNEKRIEYVTLKNNRKFFYEEIKVDANNPLRETIEKKINEIIFTQNLPKPPIIKLKIIGKETEVLAQELHDIEKKYFGRTFLRFSKELESRDMTEKLELLRKFRDQKLSIEEIGLNLLKKNLEELKFNLPYDFEDVFHMLADNQVEKTFNIMVGDQKTLQAFKG